MSLDFYLFGPEVTEDCEGRCSECGDVHGHRRTYAPLLFSRNITHNLGAMAAEAGVYQALWSSGARHHQNPTKARDLVETLRAGLALLESDRPRFEKFNAPNGWGLYEHFVPFVRACLAACEEYPDADVESNV